MECFAHLYEVQKLALNKLKALIEVDQIDYIMVQGSEVLNARLEAFMRYETTLIGQVHDYVASVMPTRYISMSKEGRRAWSLI